MAVADLPNELSTGFQGVFCNPPVVLVRSGFSCGYGLPGMGALAQQYPFWTRWAEPKADVDLVATLEDMRQQSRD